MIQKQKLKDLYESGFSMREIGEKVGKSKTTVKYWMKKYKIPIRSGSEAAYYRYRDPNEDPPESREKVTVEKVKELYYEKGYSMREVGEFFKRSESDIQRFMEQHNLPRRSSAETNNLIYARQDPSFTLKEDLTPEEENLKTAGIMLYWGEGAKEGGTIDLSNSDPRMIRLFLKFLREVCGVQEKRLRVLVYCYADQDVGNLEKYWSKITGIPLNQFQKSYVREDYSSEKSGKLEHGVAHIKYSDKKLFLQIKDWIREYLQKNEI